MLDSARVRICQLCGRLEICESIFTQMQDSEQAKPDRITHNVLMQVMRA